ncbi:MAG: rhodanese-like domain-containing protein [Candidatus Nanohaloarchaea archaeon]
MVEEIGRDELKEKLESDGNFALINVLSEEDFEEKHIPGSINIPLDRLAEEADERFDRDQGIVVYCSSPSCQASPKAAEKLEKLGFSRVKDYSGGLSDWEESYRTVSG